MINLLASRVMRPERGWDPVSTAYAEEYAGNELEHLNVGRVDQIDAWVGGLAGKRVLDLGGGPGQYSIAFARRGAEVVWHDVSSAYLRIARGEAERAGVEVEFSLGYMEEARKLFGRPFDLVFNRICWCYCMSDASFSHLIYGLVKPGGYGYVDTNITAFAYQVGAVGVKSQVIYFLNNRLWFKVGHPYPPRGRVASLFHRFPMDYLQIDYQSPTNDRVFFRKASGPAGS